jgi:hypothetical protein
VWQDEPPAHLSTPQAKKSTKSTLPVLCRLDSAAVAQVLFGHAQELETLQRPGSSDEAECELTLAVIELL